MAASLIISRVGASGPASPPYATLVSTASFAADSVEGVEGVLPYLLDVLRTVDLDAATAADAASAAYEQMRSAAAHPETRVISVQVEARVDAVAVTVQGHTAEQTPPLLATEGHHTSDTGVEADRELAVADQRSARGSRERESASPEPDRAAVVAGLTTAPAAAAALAASLLAASQERGEGRSASITVALDPGAPGSVRRQVVQMLQANAVGDDVQGDVELLVSEVLSNVVRHENSGTATVDMAVAADGGVTVTVAGGTSEPSAALVHPAGPPGPASATGRGLSILDALASAWGTRRENRRTTVWFTVDALVTTVDPGAVGEPDLGPAAAIEPIPAGGTPPSLAGVRAFGGLRGPDQAWAAAAVVAEAVAIAAATEAELTATPAIAAARAAVAAAQAAAEAASTTADAAQSARAARAAAAKSAADRVAETAVRTVDAVQTHADELALTVATAASDAAATVWDSVLPGGDAEAARATARRVGATVSSAAAAKAEETARAAVLVARAVAAAAAAVAATTAAAAAAMEQQVLDAAAAMRAVTAATAQQLADDTIERAAAVALATREAAAASERLHAANVQHEQAVDP